MEEKKRCKKCYTILMESNKKIGLCGYCQRQYGNRSKVKKDGSV